MMACCSETWAPKMSWPTSMRYSLLASEKATPVMAVGSVIWTVEGVTVVEGALLWV